MQKTTVSAVPASSTDPIQRLWQSLPRLCHFSFQARPGQQSATGWCGDGSGQTQARADGADWLLAEQGHFRPAGSAQSLPFRNSYRWQRAGDRLHLLHERFGAANAVYLFALVAVDATHLVSAQPHLCSHDSYHGGIVLHADGFDFDWQINGPRKQERLFYQYRA